MDTSPQNKQILIVEDEAPMARALELKLQSRGYSPHIASNGKEALTMIAEQNFHCVLLDLVMPEMDGFSVLATLQKEQEQAPAVFIISNLGQKEDIARAKQLGARDYFVKSDTPITQIVDAVVAALQ